MGLEVFGAVGAGVIAGSFALLAFGGDSLVELLSSFVVSNHMVEDAGGSENLGGGASRVSSLLLIALFPVIGIGAVASYLTGIRPEGSPLGIAIAIGAVLVMPYLWLRKRRIGKETRCLPLQIDAVESATCFFMALALLGGLVAEFVANLWWADYLATALILAFVAREAARSHKETKNGVPIANKMLPP
jgi:divalent metal cation (Fe/Co/Zn/Cd) transporter